jgi:predicted signal transduction protein with EAL and GGDEF domain
VLAVQSYSPLVRYSLRDQELLTFVSRHIDTALSRRRDAEALHAANLELEARVQARTRELDDVNARLLYENSHDALTGLPNRSHLMQRLRCAWRDYQTRDEQLSVMFIDLDRFKVVNDSLGHHFGDMLPRVFVIACVRRICSRVWAAMNSPCFRRMRTCAMRYRSRSAFSPRSICLFISKSMWCFRRAASAS